MKFNNYHNSRLSKQNPCYGCRDRKAECHSYCDKPIKWRKKLEEVNQKRQENIGVNTYIKESALKRRDKHL